MDHPKTALEDVRRRILNAASAAGRPPPRLLAVSKSKPASAVAALAACGQRAFGENYVQEGMGKAAELAPLELEWHLIGHLQSNKCREATEHFDWLQSLDRARLIEPLNRYRPAGRPPLNVLVQVNVDGEASKSGCAPEDALALARAVAAAPKLRLRGIMGIGAPFPEPARRRASFRRLHELYVALLGEFPGIDTLSMGMSEDFELAIAEGATMVRIGSSLFGPR
jgi:pyridoxal phosphate enzyme (YggS family)